MVNTSILKHILSLEEVSRGFVASIDEETQQALGVDLNKFSRIPTHLGLKELQSSAREYLGTINAEQPPEKLISDKIEAVNKAKAVRDKIAVLQQTNPIELTDEDFLFYVSEVETDLTTVNYLDIDVFNAICSNYPILETLYQTDNGNNIEKYDEIRTSMDKLGYRDMSEGNKLMLATILHDLIGFTPDKTPFTLRLLFQEREKFKRCLIAEIDSSNSLVLDNITETKVEEIDLYKYLDHYEFLIKLISINR